jgi:hypothetical protein
MRSRSRILSIRVACVGLGLFAAAGTSLRAVCINEVLYDPAGPDAGSEFVELYHAGSGTIDLSGWTLEAGNGASAGDWRVQWKGAPGDVVPPGGFYLIAGDDVEAEANARVRLALQNGPDAVRLVSPAGVADCVGWGALTQSEYYEGHAAPDAPSGASLARMADGGDVDDNATDFRVQVHPSPGRTNVPAWALAITGVSTEPPVIDGCHPGLLRVTLENAGAHAVPLADVRWELSGPALRFDPLASPGGALAPMQSATLTWQIDAEEATGIGTLRLAGQTSGGGEVVYEQRVRVGLGSVVIAEFLYDPVQGEGEWIELWNRADRAVDIAAWSIRDASGRATLLLAPAVISQGGRRVVVEDEAAFAAAHPEVPASAVIAREGSWPALNNTLDRERGYADEIVLTGADGVPVDYVRYAPGSLDGRGVSLERWIADGQLVDPCALVPCPAPEGATPGEATSGGFRVPDRGEGMAPAPARFFPDREGEARFCRIALPAPLEGSARVTADIYAMDGDRVATLIAGADCHGPVLLTWDGADAAGTPLPTGLYLVRAIVRATDSSFEERWVRPVTLVRDR